MDDDHTDEESEEGTEESSEEGTHDEDTDEDYVPSTEGGDGSSSGSSVDDDDDDDKLPMVHDTRTGDDATVADLNVGFLALEEEGVAYGDRARARYRLPAGLAWSDAGPHPRVVVAEALEAEVDALAQTLAASRV